MLIVAIARVNDRDMVGGSAACFAEPAILCRRTIASEYASKVRIVSSNVSPLETDETVSGFWISIVCPPSLFTAAANEPKVLLEGSKKSSDMILPASKYDGSLFISDLFHFTG